MPTTAIRTSPSGVSTASTIRFHRDSTWRQPGDGRLVLAGSPLRLFRVSDAGSRILDALENDKVICAALGDHIAEAYLAEKRAEWDVYKAQVHEWEIEEYMERF